MRRLLLSLLLLSLAAAPALRTAPATAQSAAGIVAAVEGLTPSVVGIVATFPTEGDGYPAVWTGTGVAYRADGYVLTSANTLAGASSVEVVLHDGTRVAVDRQRNVYWDPFSRLAVIYLPGNSLTPATFADSASLQPGEVALAITHPLGLQFKHSVSAGVVSGVDRRIGAGVPLIQVDAALNPGSDGAPIANQAGEVIALVYTKEVEFGFESIGYGIPATTVKSLADRLIAQHDLRRPRFGFYLSESSEVAFGWPGAKGVEIGAVEKDSPAARAGVPEWSTLLTINGTEVASQDDFYAILEPIQAGLAVTLGLKLSGGGTKTVSVITGSYPGLFDVQPEAESDGAAADPPGIWVRLTDDQFEEAADFGYWYAEDSFEQFTHVYLSQTDHARALLETEFMGVAYAQRLSLRTPGRPEAIDPEQARSRTRDRLNFRLLIGLPKGTTDISPLMTLKQGDQIVASETLSYAGDPSRAGIPLAAGADREQYRWIGAVWTVPSANIQKDGLLTLVVGPVSAPIATLAWELADMR